MRVQERRPDQAELLRRKQIRLGTYLHYASYNFGCKRNGRATASINFARAHHNPASWVLETALDVGSQARGGTTPSPLGRSVRHGMDVCTSNGWDGVHKYNQCRRRLLVALWRAGRDSGSASKPKGWKG